MEIILDMITGSLITQNHKILNKEELICDSNKESFSNKCIYIITRGPNKGNTCSSPCHGSYCKKCLNKKSVKNSVIDEKRLSEEKMDLDSILI
jgi:hypothetical protein